MTVQCFAYVRVSGVAQVKGHGPERQREDISRFARTIGGEIIGWFQDTHTGTEADRPQFMAMLAAMVDGGAKAVIVESLDRFARDLLIQSTLLARLAAEGLTLLAANTGEDVTAAVVHDPMRKAMVQIQGVFAELDKSLTVRKLRKSRDAVRRQHGRCEGRKPYGHRPGEQAVLDRLRQLRRKPRRGKRLTTAQVAEVLNREGFRNRAGRAWTSTNVATRVRARKKRRPTSRATTTVHNRELALNAGLRISACE
jgi:site-specific DNA recombinase